MQERVKQTLGLSDAGLHELVSADQTHRLRPQVIADWQRLVQAANSEGFSPIIVSSYRDFSRQAAIWSAKACGQRPVLDDDDQCLDLASMTDIQKIQAIMRFSALPGSSRHHWGTDFDIAELNCLPVGYKLQLTVSETEELMAPFYNWLNDYLALPKSDFFRPYSNDSGGVSVEPWHLSHRVESRRFETNADRTVLKAFYQGISDQSCAEAMTCLKTIGLSELPLISAVIANFDKLYDQFICSD